MDIALWSRTIWRFKWICLVGFVVACVLALLSTARVSFPGGKPHLTYRTPVIYAAQGRILVTQSGFPWGRTILPTSSASPSGGGVQGNTTYADPSRFILLAELYATLANGDEIKGKVVHPRSEEALTARPEVDSLTQAALPIIDLISLAESPQRAVRIVSRAASALSRYVEVQQDGAGIPESQRVLLQTLQQPNQVTIASPRKKTVPIVVFTTVLLATLGLILALENIRPRARLSEMGEIAHVRADEPVAAHSSRAAR